MAPHKFIINPCALIFGGNGMLTAFYGNQVYAEYDNWRDMILSGPPDGAYVYSSTLDVWYRYNIDYEQVELIDVPAMCKAWMLIL